MERPRSTREKELVGVERKLEVASSAAFLAQHSVLAKVEEMLDCRNELESKKGSKCDYG